jgi:hypothetical protein
MISFKDFIPVQYTGGESEQQDLNAFKRKRRPMDEENDALDTRRQADIKKDHESLMSKPTDEVHKIHQGTLGRIHSKYTPAEVGGKKAMIGDILRYRHGDKHVAKHFGLAEETDAREKKRNRLKKKPMVKVSVTKPMGYRIADIGAGGVEHNVKTGTI